MRIRNNKLGAAAAVCGAALGAAVLAAPAAAQPAEQGADEAVLKVLDILRSKGMVTEQEEQEVRRALASEEEREAKEREAAIQAEVAARMAAQKGPPEGKGGEKKAEEKKFPQVRVVGRVQPRYSYVDADEGQGGTGSFTLRRLRLGASGQITDDVYFTVLGDFADNTSRIVDGVLGFSHLRDTIGDIQIGQAFIPAYINSAGRTIGVERNATQYLGPGTSGRSKGIALVRGGLYGRNGQGLFNDSVHYWLGVYNGSTDDTTNDNGDFLFGGRVDLMPNGYMSGDEWNLAFTPFHWQLGVSGATANEKTGSPDFALNAAYFPGGVGAAAEIENTWTGAHFAAEGSGWFGVVQYQSYETEGDGGLLYNVQTGLPASKLESEAFLVGLSRAFKSPFNDKHRWGVGFQYQSIDNEHPARTQFFGPRAKFLSSGSVSNARTAGGFGSRFNFNEGDSYNFVLMYAFDNKVRWHLEYDVHEEDGASIDNNTFVSQWLVDF